MQRVDLTGRVIGRLTVLHYSAEASKEKSRAHWMCRCVCGVIRTIASNSLIHGSTLSCGCYAKDVAAERTARKKKRQRDYGILSAKDVAGSNAGMRLTNDPTPEEIAAMCLEIQKDWSPERLAGKGPPPVSVDGFRFSSALSKTGEFS
jgi:sRNA-binding protein